MSSKILKGPKFRYSLDDLTFGEFFFNNAEKYKDRICQIDGTIDKSETYGSVKLRSTRVAIALRKKGITCSDNITFCSPNTLDNTIPILASYYLGAKVSNLEPSLSMRHTKHLLSIVTPKIIFVEQTSVKLIEESLEDAKFTPEIIVLGRSKKYEVLSDLMVPQENEDTFRPSKVDSDDTILLLFSSGTTGLPKAICHSHRSFLYVGLQTYQTGVQDTVLHFTTFYWMTATMMLLSCFKGGNTRIFCRNPTPEDWFRIVEKYKVPIFFSAPIFTYKLTNFEKASQYDVSSLKLIACAGTPIAGNQLLKLNEVFSSTTIVNSCGMSEAGLVAAFDIETDKELIKKNLPRCGLTAAGMELMIVDVDTEEPLGPNQKGELRLKGPSVMVGYYRADCSDAFDKNGFLKTGDIGYYDEDECIYVIERIKEMFKYQQWHIVPSSIEAVLLEHPAIKEAAVFGLPAGAEGDVPSACVVLKEDSTLNENEIDKFLIGKVADRERLRGGVTFVKSLPKTPTGKIIRKDVRDLVLKFKN